MNYIKVKESQTIGSATKVIDVLIPLDRISYITGNTTTVTIEYASWDSSTNFDITIGGFGTLASASGGFQTVYALIDDLAKSPNTVSDYLKINGRDELTVSALFN
jgi:hypothetical protein